MLYVILDGAKVDIAGLRGVNVCAVNGMYLGGFSAFKYVFRWYFNPN